VRAFVDTNVLVYAVDRAEPEKRARARAILAAGEHDLVLSPQVLAEFYVVATRKLAEPVPAPAAEAMIEALMPLATVTIDGALVRTAVARSRSWGVSLWDALVLVSAEVGGCEVVFSEDFSTDRRYGAIRVVNPFESA
jgi:predicted nucleic acid-binding protein